VHDFLVWTNLRFGSVGDFGMEWLRLGVFAGAAVIVFFIARVADAFLDQQTKHEAARLEHQRKKDTENREIAIAQLAATLIAATMQNPEHYRRLVAAYERWEDAAYEPAHIVASAINERPAGESNGGRSREI
jgi:hypothetical protein